jgi:isoleucyl-tRNA synthetase
MTTEYKSTLFLPKTDLPMKANLPAREPLILETWEKQDLYGQLRKAGQGRERFVLHDGPPYANGDIHIGHAMNKILKDVIVRSQQMTGKDAPYVPGWDCHGLPIEWALEKRYKNKGKNKDDIPVAEFRQQCREFADKWIGVQMAQFKRLGVVGDWQNPYSTMSFEAEAAIVGELVKFIMDGSLYRGSKPVMWSVVEKTALAEAEIEYADHTSTAIDVGFDVISSKREELLGTKIVIWTTTPWTIPGSRAICFAETFDYVVIEVATCDGESRAQPGQKLVVAAKLLGDFSTRAGITSHSVLAKLKASDFESTVCRHPWHGRGYDFDVPLLPAAHVTLEQGTGFVHTAPGHGPEDFEIGAKFNLEIPLTVDESGLFVGEVPLVGGQHVYKADGSICDLLEECKCLFSKADFVHSYPHSWRSKAPLIFRNTLQWFVSMSETGLRETALDQIAKVRWVPEQSRKRIEAMVESRPDWVLSRQRAWGVPMTIFVDKHSGEILRDPGVYDRVVAAVSEQGADAWFTTDLQEFLGNDYAVDDYEQVTDILDVWFDSGSTHAYVLEARKELGSPASLYLEGTDQHRGWFQASLLESCATRGQAPFDAVLTHGFTLDEHGRKMAKSGDNAVSPLTIVEQSGADILRLWVVSTDYFDDVRIGQQSLQGQIDAYRKIRNTLRFLIGNLADFDESERIDPSEMPELERFMLHRIHGLDALMKQKVDDFDFNPIYHALYRFCIVDLSNFYFDIRKDCLYCDPKRSKRRRATRTVLDLVFHRLIAWLAPVLVFTVEEVWQARFPGATESVHLQQFPEPDATWKDDVLADKWVVLRRLRRVATGALEVARQNGEIGSGLDAAVKIYVQDTATLDALQGINLAELFITSQVEVSEAASPEEAFVLPNVPDLAAETNPASGQKCARCWMILEDVGQSEAYEDLCNRCTDAVDALSHGETP